MQAIRSRLSKPIFQVSSQKYEARKVLTIMFIHDKNQLLLGYKKRGFGEGKWNGAGGKVEPGETILEAAQREIHEEFGVRAVDPYQIGTLYFEFDPEYEERLLECHVFKSSQYTGVPAESEEMKPQWWDVNKLPFDQMWLDDIHWFPFMLQNKLFNAHFIFSDFNTVVKQQIDDLSQEE